MATPPIQLPTRFLDELATAGSQADVLAAVARWVPEVIPAGRASIALPDGSARLAVFALDGRHGVFEQGSTLPISGSLVGRAFESHDAVVVDDLLTCDAAEADYLVEFGLRSAVVAPIVSGDRSLGTINLANSEVAFFTQVHIEQLGSIASLIGAFLAARETAVIQTRRAETDALTQCLSRSAIIDELDRAFATCTPDVAVLYVDLDGFKSINDTHGHLTGDALLRVIAKRIRGSLGVDDRVGRLGGDEFLVVTCRPAPESAALAARIAESCSMPVRLQSIQLQPRISVGVASPIASTESALDLLHDADQAMYASKRHGATITVADELTRSHAAMVQTVDRDLDAGLASGAITLHLQPVRALHSGRLMGAEALVRWAHPKLGPIPAPMLVERLETTGRTDEFTRWTIDTACRMWRDVRQSVPWLATLPIAINLTPRQLASTDYADIHARTTASYGLNRHDVIVEVVESGEIREHDDAERTLKRLAENGVSIALDDFGVGYNALEYFARFPIHAIKFDRSLVSLVVDSPDVRTILHGLTGVSHDLGAFTIAEGIESESEAAICNDLGIAMGQGWHLGHPTTVESYIARALAEGPPRGFDAESGRRLRHARPHELPRPERPRPFVRPTGSSRV